MKKLLYAMVLIGSLFGSTQAHAVDGCKVLLCLAGNWQNISQCRPDVEQAMRDIAIGRGWPTCGGAGNSGTGLEMTSQATCPAMYAIYGETGGDAGMTGYIGCRYSYVVRVVVSGQPWTDVFWNMSRSDSVTSTRYYAPARAALGNTIDPTYDNDSAAYVPPAPPPPDTGGNGL